MGSLEQGTCLIDRYELSSELGRGGMGVVYRARDRVLEREVAVKLLAADAFSSEAQTRFEREARLVAQMDHPAIVPIFDFGRHGGALFYVMPIVLGTTLHRLLGERTLALGELIEIVAQVAEALDYSHQRGVIHRDVKPENVMVTRTEGGVARVRVMDFGLAIDVAGDRVTRAGNLPGTLAYLSPEQVLAQGTDARSDLYSLGTILYEGLAGQTPFGGSRFSLLYAIVHKPPPPLAGVDPALAALVLATLAKDPAARPQRGRDLASALRACLAAGGGEPVLPVRVAERAAALAAVRGERAPAAAPFVGRGAELAELRRCLAAAEAGECQLAILGGEVGIGKTRLLEELAAEAREHGVRVLRGRFFDPQNAPLYQGFCELIQDYFRSKESERSAAGQAELSEVAGDLLAVFPVLREIEDLRRTATGGERPSVVAEALKRGDRSHFFELLARTFALIAAGRPLLLVLENLPEAEPSLEVVEYLVRRLGPTPTLVAATCRQSPGSRRHPLKRLLRAFEGDPRLLTLVLEPLAPAEHRALLEALLGGESASEELAARLFETSEGNPFFTQELARALVDSGAAARDSTGVWDLAGERAERAEALPETIQQVVETRVERLAPAPRRVLEAAAVLGRRFELPDLEAIAEVALGAEEAARLEESVETLVREGLLEEDRQTRGERLAFASGVVRDVLYAGLPRRRRRQLHARHARHLEARWAGRLERVYAQLVHHFSAADAARETVRYALELARLSLEATGAEDAVRALRVALELVDAEELDEPLAVEGELRHRLALAERLAGRVEVGLREAGRAARAFERAGELPQAAAAARLAAEMAWQGRQVEEARRWAEKGIGLARTAELGETLVELLKLGATVANLRGDAWAARAYLEEVERLLPSAAPAPGAEVLPAGGVLAVALSNPVLHLGVSSFETVEEAEVLAHVFEPLLRFDGEGRLVPWLCESWEVQEGGRRFRFFLRAGACFADGVPLDAAAVKRSFERAAREGGAARAAAFDSILGTEDFLAGRAPEITGIERCGAAELCFALSEPLPIFPALLSDLATAVAGEDGRSGTGPFRLARHDAGRIVLERNAGYWRGRPPLLDALEFHVFKDARSIAAALRTGEVDLAHDLLPEDLEELLRDPKLGLELVETTSKNSYFAVFNASGPVCRQLAVRRVMAGAVRVEDLVWRSLGRFAQPATGLIPPGVLGHDPGRRRVVLGQGEAAAELRAAGLEPPVAVRALIHPLLLDRYGALTRALLEEWASLGIEVGYEPLPMEEFLAGSRDFAATDLWLSRWVPNYDDPDIFTYRLLHSRHGYLAAYVGSAKADELMEKARQEDRPAVRRNLYRRLESLLAEQAALLPLFHDVDYRVAGGRVRGLELLASPPYLESTRLAKTAVSTPPHPGAPPPARRLDPIHVPAVAALRHLDPAWSLLIESGEVMGNVFETLTRLDDGLHVVPWLASQVRAEEGGRCYRIRLRSNVRFHDGRRLSTRDVRYTFERLLRTPWRGLDAAFLPIRGAEPLQAGSASELAGLEIVSAEELVLELERPLACFPLMLSSPATAIVPEGAEGFTGNWREGCAGTGPFRLVHLEPGERVELEANPAYWRAGLPRSPRLVFELARSSAQQRIDLAGDRLALAGNLRPADLEALRRDPALAPCYLEQPRFATCFLAFNTQAGPLADPQLRRALRKALDVDMLVRSSLGRLVTPARGVIPPGLSGHDGDARSPRPAASPASFAGLELRAAVLPIYFGQYAPLWQRLLAVLQAMGIKVQVLWHTAAEAVAAIGRGEADLLVARWIAPYPDTDALGLVLHPRHGYIGGLLPDPRIERLFEEGRYETEPALRHAIYGELERLLEREAHLVPLFYEQTCRFARPELRGLRLRLGWPEVVYEELELVR